MGKLAIPEPVTKGPYLISPGYCHRPHCRSEFQGGDVFRKAHPANLEVDGEAGVSLCVSTVTVCSAPLTPGRSVLPGQMGKLRPREVN